MMLLMLLILLMLMMLMMLLMLLMLMILMCESRTIIQECYLVAKDGVVAQAEKAKRPQP